jgi:uncharacterized FAD-dependent dehydrogenase
MNLLVDGISLVPGQDEADLEDILTRHLNLRPPLQWRILRKSLDARSRGRIRYHYRLVVSVSEEEGRPLLGLPGVSACSEEPALEFRKAVRSCRVGVVGSGPAGLFCALRLAEAGLDVTVMERGSRVRERMKDIQGLEEEGRLDCESNVLFGEGGAGAYSDGKLTSRTASPESRWFFQRLVDLGAPSSVLYEARSHIGTDRLVGIVTRLRERLEDMGARFFFNCRVDDLLVEGGTVLGVATADGQEHRFVSPCSGHGNIRPGHLRHARPTGAWPWRPRPLPWERASSIPAISLTTYSTGNPALQVPIPSRGRVRADL